MNVGIPSHHVRRRPEEACGRASEVERCLTKRCPVPEPSLLCSSAGVVVAGGMSRGSGVPLGERRRSNQRHNPSGGANSQARAPGQHVWVVDALGQPGRWPGLLVEWRRTPEDGWEARVVYATAEPGGAATARVIERWLPAAVLEPITPDG
jgi:hypothetical protein